MKDALVQLLPPRLREIAEVIGVPAVLALSEGWPGVRLFIPNEMPAHHPIVLKIGLEAALKLSYLCAGETIPIPLNHRLLRARLRAEVLARYHQDESAATLAREYGLHEFTIYRWAGEMKNNRQSELFDAP